MSTDHSKTLLRKGVLKSHGGAAIPRHAAHRKSETSNEEESLLLGGFPAKTAPRQTHGAKMRAE